MEVVGEADNGLSAVTLTQELRPDVVVMDVSMPELNGLKATETLKTLLPDTKVLILTRHTDSSYVQQMLQSGASGYVLKQSASEELVRAIRRVAAGQTVSGSSDHRTGGRQRSPASAAGPALPNGT